MTCSDSRFKSLRLFPMGPFEDTSRQYYSAEWIDLRNRIIGSFNAIRNVLVFSNELSSEWRDFH